MASIIFGTTLDMLTVATPPSGAYVVAYDIDGILKQKDEFGIITQIGGGPTSGIGLTPSLSDVMNISNIATSPLIMGAMTSILSSNGGGRIDLDYSGASNSILLSSDNGSQLQGRLYLTSTEGTFGFNDTFIKTTDNDISFRVDNIQQFLIRNNSTASVVSNGTDKYGSIISSKLSEIQPGVVNSVVIGGQGLTASSNDTVYVQNLNINNKFTLPNIDGSNGQSLVTDGSGNISWAISSAGLANVLSTDNDSGVNSIIMGTSTSILSSNGGGQINLDYGSTSSISLSTDNGTFMKSYLVLDNDDIIIDANGTLNIGASAGTVIIDNLQGLVYGFDYSSTFVGNSLVSKTYVDSQISNNFGGTANEVGFFNGTSSITSSPIFGYDGNVIDIGSDYGFGGGGRVIFSINNGDGSLIPTSPEISYGARISASHQLGLGASSSTGIVVQSTADSTGESIGIQISANGGVNNYSLRLVDGTEAQGKFLKSVTSIGETNWAFITESDISDLGSYLPLSGGTVSGDLIVSGDLTISGTQTVINTENLYVEDNIITLNATYSGPAVIDAGVEVNLGDGTYSKVLWDAGIGYWQVGLSGSESTIITEAGSGLLKSNNTLSVDFATVSSISYVDSGTSSIWLAIDDIKELAVEVTVGEVNLLISNNDLVEGTTYKITGVHPTLYDDGTTSGTTIFLKALSDNKLTTNGHGIFYNPRYNQSVQGFGIYSNFMRGDLTSIVGDFDVNNREDVTTDNGAKGIIYTKGLIKYVSGDWGSATSITGDITGSIANIANFSNPTYSINSTVIWGGYVWKNLNGNLGEDVDILTLNSEWEKIEYNEVDYNKVLDIIEYDIDNDFITRRYDSINSIDVRLNKVTFDSSAARYGINFNSIAVMQWGNGLALSGSGASGVSNINVIDAYFENINFRGSFQVNINFNTSFQYNLTFDSNSFQNNLTFDNGSRQSNLTFDNGSRQQYLTFNSSNQYNLTFDNNSSQENLTFDNGSSQQYLTFNSSSQQYLTFNNNSYQSNLTFDNYSNQQYLTFNSSNQYNLTFNSSNQYNLTFDNGSYQENLTFNSSNQQDLTFNSSNQQDLTFNSSNQYNLTFDNGSNQQYLTFNNNSYQSNLTFDGSYQYNLTFDNGSNQYNLTFDGSNQYNLTFDGSRQENLTFDNGSSQQYLTFDNYSNQQYLTFDNYSNQQYLTFDGSSQRYLTFDALQLYYNAILYTSKSIQNLRGVGFGSQIIVPGLTSATNIFDNTLIKEIVVTPNGTFKIKYLDDMLTYQFVDMDS